MLPFAQYFSADPPDSQSRDSAKWHQQVISPRHLTGYDLVMVCWRGRAWKTGVRLSGTKTSLPLPSFCIFRSGFQWYCSSRSYAKWRTMMQKKCVYSIIYICISYSITVIHSNPKTWSELVRCQQQSMLVLHTCLLRWFKLTYLDKYQPNPQFFSCSLPVNTALLYT